MALLHFGCLFFTQNRLAEEHCYGHYLYLTTEELSERIKYDCRTIRQNLKDSVLLEGKHYIKPFGRRKILFLWEEVEKTMLAGSRSCEVLTIPMANGEVCHV